MRFMYTIEHSTPTKKDMIIGICDRYIYSLFAQLKSASSELWNGKKKKKNRQKNIAYKNIEL